MLAEEIKKGIEAKGDVEAVIYRVPETLSSEVLEKMGAPPKADYPVITAADLELADGFMFGLPTRFGMAAAQMKAFWDSTGGQWQSQSLAHKPAGIFVTTGTQGGGQETTALTWITQLTHQQMLFVPLGYGYAEAFTMEELKGGSPYGAGSYAGADGSRMPTATEKKIAGIQGERFAVVVKKLK